MNAQVHQLAEARAYSEAQFDCEREDIRKTYGDSGVEAKALGEQALAALFYRSGWTQEQLAKKEGCKRVVVSYRLTFGRFLAFVTSGDIPRNLTERRFRGYWQRTEGSNERQRFAAVAKLIQEDIRVGASTSSKPAVGKALREQFADGAWHRVPTMARHVGASTEDVVAVLNIMRDHGSYGCHCERKQVGKARSSLMSSFKLLKSEVKPLTPELAAQFREMEPSPTERDLNPSRLKNLREKAEAGHLVTFQWATAKMGDKVLRMNGQHSSNVLCELNGSFPKGLYAHIDQYEVDGPQGLALLFRQFDDRKSGRTAGDVAGAFQMLEPALHGVAKPIGKLGVEGTAWYRRTIEGVPVGTGDVQYTLFNEPGLHSFLLWLNEPFSIKTPELKKVQVVAAMYATFIKNAEEAKKFWDEVARGGREYEDNAPSTVLDNWLKAAKEGDLKEDLKPAQFYQGCIYAWNAYREEKSLKDIKADTRKSWLNPIE